MSVEVDCIDNGDFNYNLLHACLNGDKVEVKKQENGIESTEELFSFLKKEIPILLSFTGKGVLIKKIKTIEEKTDFVQLMLPNANSSDFISQIVETKTNEAICAIVRKSQVDEFIKLLKSKDLFVVDVNVGFSSMAKLVGLIDLDTNKIRCSNYKLSLKEDKITDFTLIKGSRTEEEIEIGDHNLNSRSLIVFSAIIQYLISKNTLIDELDISRREFKAFNTIKSFIPISLGLVFIVLLINYFLFDHFYNKSNLLQSELSNYSDLLAYKKSLSDKIKQRESLIDDLGLESNNSFSYIFDRIVANQPESISLNSFIINPQIKTRNKKLIYDENRLIIKGITSSSVNLNNWIRSFKTLDWIKKATLSDYEFIENRLHASFEISIELSKINYSVE